MRLLVAPPLDMVSLASPTQAEGFRRTLSCCGLVDFEFHETVTECYSDMKSSLKDCTVSFILSFH